MSDSKADHIHESDLHLSFGGFSQKNHNTASIYAGMQFVCALLMYGLLILRSPSALLHHKAGLFAAQASTKGEAIIYAHWHDSGKRGRGVILFVTAVDQISGVVTR